MIVSGSSIVPQGLRMGQNNGSDMMPTNPDTLSDGAISAVLGNICVIVSQLGMREELKLLRSSFVRHMTITYSSKDVQVQTLLIRLFRVNLLPTIH